MKLDLVIVPHQSSKVHVLLWGLKELHEQPLQTAVICKNGKVVAEKILPPLLDRRRDCKHFSDISGGPLKLGRQWLTKICDGMALLGKDCTHAYTRSVCLNCEW